jgi:glycine/D-amino acid oxidase-like deaminating enzyme
MKRIAVIGSGLSGLAAAAKLIHQDHQITVFHDNPGASYAASGLLHMFVGDTGEKSLSADEAFKLALDLIKSLKKKNYLETPFERKILNDQMRESFTRYEGTDLEFINEETVKIFKGVILDVPSYLEDLKERLVTLGARFINQKINSLSELKDFNHIIVAAGYGIKELVPTLKMKFLKGQSLFFNNQHQHECPLIAKGYLVPFEKNVIIGATYERQFDHERADIYKAYQLLEKTIIEHFKPYDEMTPMSTHAGIRVAHPNFNHPKILIFDAKTIILTGYGSRGILYHALIAEKLKDFSCLFEIDFSLQKRIFK